MIKNILMLIYMFVVFVGLIGCGQTSPPKEFLDSKVGVVYSNGVMNIVDQVKLRDVIGEITKPANWEKVDNNQWMYRIKSEDPITKKKDESVLLFVRPQERNDSVLLSRVVLNGEDLPTLAKDQFFNQMMYGIMQKKDSTKQLENKKAIPNNQSTNQTADKSSANKDVQVLKEEFANADKEINLVYKDLMKKLSPGVKTELKNEQIAWIKEKERKCNAETSDVNRLNCLIKMTTERTSQLKTYSSK